MLVSIKVLIESIPDSVNLLAVVSGGFALVAGSLIAGTGSLTPALALLFGNIL